MNRIKVIIYRSNTSIEAQAISEGKTVLGKKFTLSGKDKLASCESFGQEFGKLLLEKKVLEISYDRNGLKYHGKVKSFAEGMRKAGVKF